MELEAIAHLLGSCEVLGDLDRSDRLRLAALAQRLRQPAGAVIFFQGDAPDALYVVRRGAVRIVQQVPDGRELQLGVLRTGVAFGEIALLDGAPRTATAVVLRDAELVRIPRVAFLDAVRSNPDLALAVIRVLCGRVRSAGTRVEEGLFMGARARLARHLQRLVSLRGQLAADGVAIDEHLPQAELGAATGLSRQTVNRELQQLQAEGVVRIRRARLVVLDPDALERACHGRSGTHGEGRIEV